MGLALALPWRRNGAVVGIDLGPSAIKAVALGGQGQRVLGSAIEPLPDGAVSEQGIAQLDAVAEALRRAYRAAGNQGAVVMALPSAAVMQRVSDLPRVPSEREFETYVQDEVVRMSPFPLEELRYDWCVLGDGVGEDTLRTFIAAARQERIEELQALADAAGVTLAHVDVEALALHRVFAGAAKNGTFAWCDLGHKALTLSVWRGVERLMERSQPFEGERLRRDLARLLRSEDEVKRCLETGAWSEEAQSRVVTPVLEKVGAEVANLLKFFFASFENVKISELYLCGGIAALPGADKVIQRFIAPVVRVADLIAIAGLLGRTQGLSPRMTLALGLALWGRA